MTTPTISAVQVDTLNQGVWDWNTSAPTWRPTRYGVRTTLDPFPAYPHDLGVIRATADRLAELLPPRWPVTIYSMDREDVCRTNGHADVGAEGHYDDGNNWVKNPPEGVIVLSAKRVQPHPAMTRYLVAHEYGHQTQWMIADVRGAKNMQDDVILTEYAEMRGLPTPTHYGSGGRWHDSCAEIFACDFRLVVAGIEAEFWPHPGIDRPNDAVHAWWSRALDELRNAAANLRGDVSDAR